LRISLPSLSFRTKVVLLAVLLVIGIQCVTLPQTLRAVKEQQQREADRTVELAGVVYDEYTRHRTELLTRVVDALVRDFPFRTTVAEADPKTIESALRNNALRAHIDAAAIFDLEGNHIASIGGGRALWPRAAMERFAIDPNLTEPVVSIGFIGGKPYHTVTLPIKAPVPIAWATMGLPIDSKFAADINELTRLESTIVGFHVGGKEVYATTLPDDLRSEALADVRLGDATELSRSYERDGWITELRPYRDESDGIYVALQLPIKDALAAYRELRDSLIGLSAIALLLTLGAAVWLPRLVTRPIGQLVDAARRMAEGIYNQPLKVNSRDEFGVLAQGFNSMQEAIAQREQHILHMAHHDSLSGLPTREMIVGEIRDAIANVDQLAIINLVLHRFDELAASLGHRTADRLIQLVAARLRDRLEDGQLLGHLNHQEFVLVLPGATFKEAEARVCDIQSMLRAGLAVGQANISLQIRAGVSLFPDHGINASELLRCAAIARGNASHHLGSVGIYEPGQEEKSLKLIRIVGDFPRALQNNELWVEFQPKINCESLELNGAEALVRWEHSRLGRLSPETFIEAIERAGGISQLTRWVLDETAATVATWRARGLMVPVSVNISAHDLIDNYLPTFLESRFSRYGIVSSSLTLEVTESAIMRDVEHSLSVIRAIRALGCKIAIDDFGTGHSALDQLKRLPVDELKIDKSFVLNIHDRRDEAVVRMAIELAHQFGLTAVAEGVEDEASLLRLQQLGCETAQGFYFSKALAAGEFFAWASAWAAGEGADIVTLVDSSERPRRVRT
jgi:diguanylate cyclase (GGDEF)-like protein